MAHLLHILTKPNDALAQNVIAEQQKNAANNIEVLDLNNETDYKALLDKIFAADSVQVW